MSFNYETVLSAAVLVAVPAIFAIFSVKRHVSKFMRDVEAEEQAEKDSGEGK